MDPMRPPNPTPAAGLRVVGLTRACVYREVSFEVRPGEVVALAGLVGSGRSEVVRGIFGLDPADGEVWVGDQRIRDTQSAIEAGVGLVPEDRQHEGLHLPMSVGDNLSMVKGPSSFGFRQMGLERQGVHAAIADLGIKVGNPADPVSSVSGGNQQKVLLGKWLALHPSVLILDEPTRGVDVGAKAQIHERIRALADQGAAVLVVSSEIPEVLALADRVLVMREGQIAGALGRNEASPERILAMALPEGGQGTAQPSAWKPQRSWIGVALLGVLVAATAANPSFASAENLRDLLVKTAPAVIVGSLLTLVVMAREIDISVGSLMGLCAAALGIACSTDRLGLPVPVSVGICLALGLLGGLLNGAIVAWGRVPSIIVTLGTLTVFRGVTELLLGGRWIENLPKDLRAFGTGDFQGLPYSVIAALTVAGVAWAVAARTPIGLRVRALGSNPAAADLRGMPSGRLRLTLFGLSGLGAGVAALFSATQLQVIESGFGAGFELVAVASVIVGGTSIMGGRGSVLGTVCAAWLLGSLSTVLIFLRLGDAATYWERMVQGVLILLAVLVDRAGRRDR